MQALIARKDESYGSTEGVLAGTSGARGRANRCQSGTRMTPILRPAQYQNVGTALVALLVLCLGVVMAAMTPGVGRLWVALVGVGAGFLFNGVVRLGTTYANGEVRLQAAFGATRIPVGEITAVHVSPDASTIGIETRDSTYVQVVITSNNRDATRRRYRDLVSACEAIGLPVVVHLDDIDIIHLPESKSPGWSKQGVIDTLRTPEVLWTSTIWTVLLILSLIST